MKSYSSVKEELLRDPECKKEYDALAESCDIAKAVIRARLAAGLTQAELAEEIGTKQSNISRLESGRSMPTVDILSRVAKATGRSLLIDIV